MRFLGKLIVFLGTLITTILIIVGTLIFFLIIGYTIFEMTGKSNLGIGVLCILLFIGLVLGIRIAMMSNRIGFIKFISKVSATNEMDDPEKVDNHYS